MTYCEFAAAYHLQLNNQQAAAVQATNGPVLLLAVPGSGKTTVLVARLGYLIHACSVPPCEILTMTYTVAATQELRRRFATLFGEALAAQMQFRTLNGLCALILRHYERTLGRTAFTLLTDSARQTAILAEIYRKTVHDFPTENILKTLQTAITYAKNMMLTDEEILDFSPEDLPFAALYQAYCDTLRSQSLMDYDDQMTYAYQVLRRYPAILEHFRRCYPYICVDEAQDTSRIQHSIINLLATASGNLFLVGDEDQSIYGFRAAYPQALLEFESQYPSATVLLMEQNYRSTQQIVTAADAFIQKNKNRHPKQMHTKNTNGKPVSTILVKNRQAQYTYLKRMAQQNTCETAVLYRDNDSVLPLLDLLHRSGIKYCCRQVESSFFSHRIVRDIVDILTFAQAPHNGEVFLRIYYKLGAGISKAAANAAVSHASARQTLLQHIAAQKDTSSFTVRQCRALDTHFRNLQHESADRALYRITHFMGYGEYLDTHALDTNKLQILQALSQQEPSAQRFLARLAELQTIVGQGSTDTNSLFTLSTIHSSKGLEYERVVLLDVLDGVFPKALAPQNAEKRPDLLESYEEERRLFYVGMTRAKSELLIFQFEHSCQTSCFAAELFPPPAKPSTPQSSVTVQRPASHLTTSQAPSQAAIWEAKSFLPGMRVQHRLFGKGKIIEKNGDVATVQFADGTQKRLSLPAVLQDKILMRHP